MKKMEKAGITTITQQASLHSPKRASLDLFVDYLISTSTHRAALINFNGGYYNRERRMGA